MKVIERYITFLFCILFLKSTAQPFQNINQAPHYFIENFLPKDYNASLQNWSFTQTKSGVLLVGNVRTILAYDGKVWNQIDVSNSLSIRSMDTDEDGAVYVGTNNDFGKIIFDKKGRPSFFSLASKVGVGVDEIKEVWKTHCTPQGVFFQAESGIFLIKNNQLIKKWTPGEFGFHFGFFVNNQFWVREKEKGLLYLDKNNQLVLPQGENKFKDIIVTAVLPYGIKDSLLIATKDQGFFLGVVNTATTPIEIKYSAFKTQTDALVKTDFIYKGIKLSNGLFAFSIYNNGLLVINRKGELITHISKQTGLTDNRIWCLFEDAEKNLWLGQDKGISKIEYGLNLRYYNEQDGLVGQVQTIAKNNTLQVGTTQGGFTLKDNNTFMRIENLNDAVWEILELNNPIPTTAYASKGGLSVINQKDKIFIEGDFRSIVSINNDFYSVAENELVKITIEKTGKINVSRKEFPIGDVVQKMDIDANKNIWLGLLGSGVSIIENPFSEHFKIKSYDTANGLPDVIANKPFRFNNDMLLLTVAGIYQLNNNHFTKSSYQYKWFKNDSLQVWSAFKDSKNRLWMQINRFTKNGIDAKPEIGYIDLKTNTWQTSALSRISKTLVHSFTEDKNGNIYFASDDGIFILGIPEASICPTKPIITSILSGKDTLLISTAGNTSQTDSLLNQFVQIDYKSMPITIKYGWPVFISPEKVMYSYYLDGVDKEWSEWTTDTKKEFSQLSPGIYTYKVKAKNIFGNQSAEIRFSFTVLPPWYLTWWAYLLYIVAAIVIIYGIVQLSVYRLKQAKIHLEFVVTERTAQVVKQKDEILSQKTELEQQKIEIEKFNDELSLKNKEITDSIQYAKKIQEALLVEEAGIYKLLPQCFVLYKPRDIVSGDFYWFRPLGDEFLFAAADCTGHGVPGAFMSMIGSTLLNEIVDEKNIHSPDKILDQLNIEIIRSLKQNEETSQSRDGMDIALCKFNLNGELSYAGAMRPLYIIKKTTADPEFAEVKATKHPIGGKQAIERESYQLHQFKFNKGDTVYFFSDGYADQFGGENGKKFMTKKFQQLLLSINHHPMEKQKTLLCDAFNDWKGRYEQVDDVLVVGVRF